MGLRGVRIQNIVNELHGEKIDVVEWNKDLNVFIASALSGTGVILSDPAKANDSRLCSHP